MATCADASAAFPALSSWLLAPRKARADQCATLHARFFPRNFPGMKRHLCKRHCASKVRKPTNTRTFSFVVFSVLFSSYIYTYIHIYFLIRRRTNHVGASDRGYAIAEHRPMASESGASVASAPATASLPAPKVVPGERKRCFCGFEEARDARQVAMSR